MTSEQLLLLPQLPEPLPEEPPSGLVPAQMLQEMLESHRIKPSTPFSADQVQPCSLDLRLGQVAYKVPASFLPGRRSTVWARLERLAEARVDLTQPAQLNQGSVYVIPLQEELFLPDNFSARGNPKSTTGRLDVFTRLITDYAGRFEQVPSGYRGKLYAEVIPLTFPVIVREGSRLNQLRITYRHPRSSHEMLFDLNRQQPIVYQGQSPVAPLIESDPAERRYWGDDLRLTVDICGVEGSDIVGYEAKKNVPPIDLSLTNHYSIQDYWRPIYRNDNNSILLGSNDFYILVSRERVVIPPTHAAEMTALDPEIGEFRTHYAGFFDPGFGWSPEGEAKGSHAVLEVRSHNVPSILEHGQEVARLTYERLLARPEKLYGGDIGSSYQSQRLKLSKHFKKN